MMVSEPNIKGSNTSPLYVYNKSYSNYQLPKIHIIWFLDKGHL